MSKVTRGELVKAVRLAMKTSLVGGSRFVPVAHDHFAGYELSCRRTYPSRVQPFPTTEIELRNASTRLIHWCTTAAYLSTCIDTVLRDGGIKPIELKDATVKAAEFSE
jgi:hypothetical protein